MLTDPAAPEAAFLLAAVSPVNLGDPLSIPYGDILSDVLAYVGTALFAVVMWAFRFLPAQIYSLLMTMRADQLLAKAISFGINATKDATKDKVLTIDVSNAVLREALGYALLHGGGLVKKFMGEPEEIAEKLYARLNVDAAVAKPNFGALAVETIVAVETRQPERAEKAGVAVL